MPKIIADLTWSKAEDIKSLYTEKSRAFGDRMGVYALLRRKKNGFSTSYIGASNLVLNRIRKHNDKNFSKFKFATIKIRGLDFVPVDILRTIELSLIYVK